MRGFSFLRKAYQCCECWFRPTGCHLWDSLVLPLDCRSTTAPSVVPSDVGSGASGSWKPWALLGCRDLLKCMHQHKCTRGETRKEIVGWVKTSVLNKQKLCLEHCDCLLKASLSVNDVFGLRIVKLIFKRRALSRKIVNSKLSSLLRLGVWNMWLM